MTIPARHPSLSAVLHRRSAPSATALRNVTYCGDDAAISTATTKIAAHILPHIIVCCCVAFSHASDRRHDLPRGTVAALQRVMIEKRLLHRGQAAPGGTDSLDCRDLLASGLNRQGETRQGAVSVDMDGTRATLSDIAALFRSAEIEPLTKGVEESDARFPIQ